MTLNLRPIPLRLFRLAVIAIGVLAAACASVSDSGLQDANHPLAGRLWDVSAKVFIDEAELLRRVAGAEMVLLGETHDNPEHHRLQQRVLQLRLAAGAKPVLAMEQFDTDQQTALDEARRNGRDLSTLMRGWDWPHYAPLVAMADASGLPLLAANLSRTMVRPVVREGYAALPAGDVQRLALESVWDDSRQSFMVRLIEESHCGKISPSLRDGLVRAQRLRDAVLADAVLPQIDRGVVFILGRGHARRDVGVPRYIEARRPGSRQLSVGLVEVDAGKPLPTQYETEQVGGLAAHDVLWFTPRFERPDPCLAFGK